MEKQMGEGHKHPDEAKADENRSRLPGLGSVDEVEAYTRNFLGQGLPYDPQAVAVESPFPDSAFHHFGIDMNAAENFGEKRIDWVAGDQPVSDVPGAGEKQG
jgi:hypothetical protein